MEVDLKSMMVLLDLLLHIGLIILHLILLVYNQMVFVVKLLLLLEAAVEAAVEEFLVLILWLELLFVLVEPMGKMKLVQLVVELLVEVRIHLLLLD